MRKKYAQLLDAKTEKLLTSVYTFYNQNRHPYMHASADTNNSNTAIIFQRTEADKLFKEIVLNMKTNYEKYDKPNRAEAFELLLT